ncbi:hypothetical protein ACFWPU_11880 [Streptomyces sp. NPDC058471]|uniref:hypothetical protein n=1 Tax=Streptomyces sp. NPDC058471 TaxID=3346516 RepID=UPI003651C0CC
MRELDAKVRRRIDAATETDRALRAPSRTAEREPWPHTYLLNGCPSCRGQDTLAGRRGAEHPRCRPYETAPDRPVY